MTDRGKPHLTLRLEPEVMEALRERAGAGTRGTSGGVARYVRALIYEHLGLSMPVQYGDLGRSSAKRHRNG